MITALLALTAVSFAPPPPVEIPGHVSRRYSGATAVAAAPPGPCVDGTRDPGDYEIKPYECSSAPLSIKSAGISAGAMMVAQGTADFISARAQQELVQWFLDTMAESLCDQVHEWFPRTCRLHEGLKDSVIPSRSVLVSALKRDATTAVVKLFERIDPVAGVAFAEVMVGLLRHVRTGEKPVAFLAGISSVNELRTACTSGSPVTDGVKLACALIVTGEVTRAYLGAGGTLEHPPDPTSFGNVLVASTTLTTALNKLGAKAGSNLPADELLATIRDRARAMKSIIDSIQAKSSLGIEPSVSSEYVRQLAAWVADTMSQITEALDEHVTFPGYWESSTEAISAFSARDYAAGFRATLAVLSALPEPIKKEIPQPIVDYLPLVTDLASAESAEDVQTVLDAAATPVGGWRAKRTRWLASVGAVLGPDASYEIGIDGGTAESTGVGVGLFAPVGVDLAWPIRRTRSAGGLFISAVDVGNLIDYRLTDTAGDGESTKAAPEIGFIQLLAPGLFAKFGLGPSPFTVVVGGAWTPQAREFTDSAGETLKLDTLRIIVSLGVDVTMFPF